MSSAVFCACGVVFWPPFWACFWACFWADADFLPADDVFPVVFLAAALPVDFWAAVDELDTNNLSREPVVGAARPVPVNSRRDIVARPSTKPRIG
jgi:hypothetical protein